MIYTVIDDFVDYLQQVLGYCPSVYLHGSVMTDDFTPNSDVDLLVVVPQRLTEVQTTRLLSARKFLAEVRKTANFLRIEGSIVFADDLLAGKSNAVLCYGNGKQSVVDYLPLTALDIFSLKTNGKLLCGEDVLAKVAIPTRSQIVSQLQLAVNSVAQWGKADGSKNAYECLFWLVRSLYTFQTNQLASKSDCMLWALDQGFVSEKVAMQAMAYRVTPTSDYTAKMKQNLISAAWQKAIDGLLALAITKLNATDTFVEQISTDDVYVEDGQPRQRQRQKLTFKRKK